PSPSAGGDFWPDDPGGKREERDAEQKEQIQAVEDPVYVVKITGEAVVGARNSGHANSTQPAPDRPADREAPLATLVDRQNATGSQPVGACPRVSGRRPTLPFRRDRALFRRARRRMPSEIHAPDLLRGRELGSHQAVPPSNSSSRSMDSKTSFKALMQCTQARRSSFTDPSAERPSTCWAKDTTSPAFCAM
ncbi:MAG TPA: hypothetical protein VKA15_08645, partial [Isosphaeraceae bacterium]|nr:hypothetical protein [Isosphaeraceae bacterium]